MSGNTDKPGREAIDVKKSIVIYLESAGANIGHFVGANILNKLSLTSESCIHI